jgi:D-alanyl-D-alanine carboxypeptidase
MLPRDAGAQQGLRWGLFSLVTVISVLAVTSDPSDARSHRKSTKVSASEAASEEPRYSDIVVDGNSSAILHAANPDGPRHPASLTKIMTLYLLFEQLEAGKLRLDSQLEVSEHAAGQSPTKLGLRSGQTIKVEDAIKGIVTRSANDAAVVVAEAVGGDEESFAKLMTRQAQAMGMSHTVYRNASGLPNDEQITTARDQSILGRTIQERFPRYYKYFATRSFEFRGESIGNHNHLLGSVEGVDGIKTGYISASGFNLVTSVHRDNRYLVAVVFGGSSAGSRDERMRQLIKDHIAEAATQHPTSMVAAVVAKPESKPEAKVETKPDPKAAAKPEPKPDAVKPGPAVYSMASAASVPVTLNSKSDPGAGKGIQVPRWAPTAAAPLPATAPAIGSAEPIHPVLVRTVTLRPGSVAQTASPAATASLAPAADANGTGSAPASPSAAPPPPAETTIAAAPSPVAPGTPTATGSVESSPELAASPRLAASPAPIATAALPAPRVSAPPASSQVQTHTGWIIQVGAFPAADEAKQRLSLVQSRASRFLAKADAFTETVSKGDTTLYRARFAGLAKEQAEAACKYLKHNDLDCMTIKN